VPSPPPQRIVIAGAGSIGCYVGGQLAAAGREVRFLARPRFLGELEAHGLTVSDHDGGTATIAAADLVAGTDPAAMLAGADVVLVTVKSGATREIAASIARFAPADAVVVSLQNGVDNAALLEAALPGRQVVAGMVPFNVAALGDGRFHRGTDGTILIDAQAAALAAARWRRRACRSARIPTCGGRLGQAAAQPQQRAQRARRRAAAGGAREPSLAAPACGLHRRGARRARRRRHPAGEGRRAAAVADPDGAAPARPACFASSRRRSSRSIRTPARRWADDLAQRRLTEIDQLQGRVVALAKAERGTPAPVNRAVLALVKAAEARSTGSPRLRPEDVRAG
jgi:2-dehydropantoate 2-reductase